VLVAEGAIEAALAEAGHSEHVVDAGRGVPAGPELVPSGLQHLSLVEAPGSDHTSILFVLDYIVHNISVLDATVNNWGRLERGARTEDDAGATRCPRVRLCERPANGLRTHCELFPNVHARLLMALPHPT